MAHPAIVNSGFTPETSGTSHPSVWLAYWNGAECTGNNKCSGNKVYTEMIGDEPGTQRLEALFVTEHWH
ncbi:hypothetical protein Q5O89_10335 [Peribacillus frigoritolerans]|nr:hypothetical protein [Peribacillus frigoritolerans]